MPSAISNTSPLLYLYRISKIDLLPRLFEGVFTVPAVVDSLRSLACESLSHTLYPCSQRQSRLMPDFREMQL